MTANEGQGKDNSSEIHSVDEIDYFGFLENAKASADEIILQVVKCNNCYASTTVGVASSDNACPYCGDKLITGDLKPESVIKPWGFIPFRFNQTEAINAYKKWIKKRWFAPSAFYQLSNFQSLYIPYWTFDTYANVQFIGKRGEEFSDGDRVQVLWFDVVDEIQQFFDDILICATDSVNEELVNRLRPWETKDLIPFDTKYQEVHICEKYNIDLETAFQKAQDRITEGIEALLITHIGGDLQEILKARTSYTDITFKHILLPVYFLSHDFRGKRYQILINGKTGKIEGKLPRSWGKIGLAIVASLGLLSTTLWLLIA